MTVVHWPIVAGFQGESGRTQISSVTSPNLPLLTIAAAGTPKNLRNKKDLQSNPQAVVCVSVTNPH
jgi:hypothetical protein